MTYTAAKTSVQYDPEELRSRIPGWGVDSDPANRPSFPKDRMDLETGAHWDIPEPQPETYPREKTPEHKFLTPVFGTAQPPRGLSGWIRRRAYEYSEGRMRHWMMLVAADRVDVVESRIGALLHGRPDRAFSELGLRSEFTHHGIRSRRHQHRADLKHQPIDMLMLVGRYAAIATLAFGLTRLAMRGQRTLSLR